MKKMGCNVHSDELPEFIITIIPNSVGVFVTILSTVSTITNKLIPISVRKILISFSLANFFGICMLAYDNIQMLCYHGDDRLSCVIPITVTLSIGHLVLLTLNENIKLISRSKRTEEDYTCLILLFWIISITVGSIDVIALIPAARITFTVTFLIIIFLLFTKYFSITKQVNKEKRVKQTYKATYLKNDYYRKNLVKTYWKLKFFAFILFSYVACSTPWVINELVQVFQTEEENHLAHSICLIIYSMNFFVPSAICIYLKYQQWIIRLKIQTF